MDPGTYYENLVIDGKQLTLRSSQGAEVTVIDGSGETESVIHCLNGAGAEVIIEGFTITGGSGGGIPIVGHLRLRRRDSLCSLQPDHHPQHHI